MQTISTRNVTRNQSTADYQQERVFLGSNDFQEAVFLNDTGAELVLESGLLVKRDTTTPGQIIPAVTGVTLADIIGVVMINGTVTLADDETAQVNYAINGDVDSGLLIAPDTVTLDTVVGNKSVKDILTTAGFNPKAVTELTQFDN